MKSSEKGMCKYMKIFYGWVTVSDKGQIALPKEAREDLNIKTGEKLLVIARKDRKGVILVKADVMNKFFENLQEGGDDNANL